MERLSLLKRSRVNGYPGQALKPEDGSPPDPPPNMEMKHMIKKLMLAIATLVASMSFAFAQVDVNKADAAALDSVKGVGPSMSKKILDERTKNGDFKDWADFQKRVKGVGEKNAAKLSQAGLQVNGKSKEGAEMTAKPADAKAAKSDKAAKAPKTTAKPDAKKPADTTKPATM
jgi:competence protein ComEA